MAYNYPYVTTMSGLTQLLDQLRKSFPTTLDADTLKKLSLAPNNEGVVINTVRFLGLIDEQNARTELGQKVFTLHDDEDFRREFSDVIKNAYTELFALHTDDTWQLSQTRLITFFRQADKSTERVGLQQARTFKTLASYVGHGDAPLQSRSSTKPPQRQTRKKTSLPPVDPKPTAQQELTANTRSHSEHNVGLTVRIEINLPVAEDQETYDKIFRSIRENLLNDPEQS